MDLSLVDFVLGVLLQVFSPAHKDTADMGLITVTWDHAVNSQEKLRNALTSPSKMVEADVITGHLIDENGEGTDRIPIMGHPPAITSDLSLKQFLGAWNHSDKGLKLDFKSTDAFMSALPVMVNAFKDIPQNRQPWLNADILPGPGPGGNPGVDADTFLRASSQNFPDSILSLGWTTKRNDHEMYSENYINGMVDVLFKAKYMRPVTYAVRASFAMNSISELQYLLETSPAGSTLTVWCSDPADVVDTTKLVHLVNAVGSDRVYLDLPDDKSKTFFETYAVATGGGNVIGGLPTALALASAVTVVLKTAMFL